MAEGDEKSTSGGSRSKVQDGGNAEVQAARDRAEETGTIGTPVDPIPNEEHSLESGPDAPTAAEQRAALAEKRGDN